LTQQLVEKEGAIAIVHGNSPLAANGSRAYLEQHNIPVIGTEGGSDFLYSHPNYFPQVASGKELGYITDAGLVGRITPEQRKHVGFISCLENPTCSAPAALASQFDMTVVYNGSASLTTLDFTSQCSAAKQAGAQVFYLGMDPNSIHRIAASCASVNFHPQLVTSASVVLPDMATDPNLDGMLIPAQTKPWMLAGDPAIAEYQAVLARYGPGVGLNGASVSGWTSAKLFELAAASLGDTPTSAALLDALGTIKGNDLGGLTGPLTFTKGQNPPRLACWFLVQVSHGKFISPNDGARQCRA
jgi:branched-chain amino acid transport system substrate-binding protein